MSAILMAMLDGIQNRVNPGRPQDKDLYDLAPEERAGLTCTPPSLDAALNALESDHDFLLRGDVFTPDVLAAGSGTNATTKSTPSTAARTRTSLRCILIADSRSGAPPLERTTLEASAS